MLPTELHIYDFDGALYNSPKPKIERGDWWWSPKSLRGYGPPGQDARWIMPTVKSARHSVARPDVMAVLCTARPLTGSLQACIKKMLFSAGIHFGHHAMKPLGFRSSARYKAERTRKWLEQYPSIEKVVFWDDLPENLVAVGKVVRSRGLSYTPIQTPGLSG
jgi:hypothetical protein